MSHFADTDVGDAAYHPILTEPWTYFVAGVAAEFDRISQLQNSLNLTLVRNGEVVRLRFVGVEQLEIDAGFPNFVMGLQILDISHLGWDSLKLRVTGFEPVPGIRFWAKSVELLPELD